MRLCWSTRARAFPRAAPGRDRVKAEGYEIVTRRDAVIVAGNDARGVLFGVGRLLRALDYGRERVALATALNVASAPRYGLRGHQFGYRPKTNSYDGWTVAMSEQYLREIVAYGANAIEIIPPRSDDAADSPHFNLSPMRDDRAVTAGAGVWHRTLDIRHWIPTMRIRPKWTLHCRSGEVLRQLPKVDAVFIPGGDPGHTPPKHLFPMMEKQARQLRQYHSQARVWMSPQGFDANWMHEFFALMNAGPSWLEGVVFGPQQRVSVEELRANIPARYPIRFYPDITHTLNAQYPVPEWDYAFQTTLNREPINPRPLDQAAIFHRLQPHNVHGVLTYSEGCNDDVNKCIWARSAGTGGYVLEILHYSRYLSGPTSLRPRVCWPWNVGAGRWR